MEILELKNIITEIKHSMDGLKKRMEETEERIGRKSWKIEQYKLPNLNNKEKTGG